jgi:hypothetical protein
MKRIAPFLLAGALVSAGLLAGCDSQASLIANPGTAGNVPTVPATLQVDPTTKAMSLLIPDASLTPEMKAAKSLKILIGSAPIPLSKAPAPATGLVAPVPQTGGFDPDLSGKQRFTFILDRTKTQVVDVQL